MEEAKNRELDDAKLADATGGDMDPFYDTATVIGIVMVNPMPDNPYYTEIWEGIQEEGYTLYEIEGEGQYAVAKTEIEALTPGEAVYVRHIRGYYGWQIMGKVNDL